MRAADIFEVDDLIFLEPNLDSMDQPFFNEQMAMMPAERGKVLINEDDWPIAAAMYDGGWKVGTFLYRGLSEAIIERLEEMEISIKRVDQGEWEAAVREYYCHRLMEEMSPYPEDINLERVEKVRDLLVDVWGKKLEGICLDVGCGSGMGSIVIRELGMTPLAYDNDPTLLALGLQKGRLLPEETALLDATIASSFIRPAPRALILMAGEINLISMAIWRGIIADTIHLAERTLVTTGTEQECRTVAAWAKEEGCEAKVLENDRDPFYDHWVCDIIRP
jgi:hypothetical protein